MVGGQNYVEFLASKQNKKKRYYPWVEGYAETKWGFFCPTALKTCLLTHTHFPVQSKTWPASPLTIPLLQAPPTVQFIPKTCPFHCTLTRPTFDGSSTLNARRQSRSVHFKSCPSHYTVYSYVAVVRFHIMKLLSKKKKHNVKSTLFKVSQITQKHFYIKHINQY